MGAVLFGHFTIHEKEPWNTGVCNNIMFYALIFCQLWHVLNMTSGKKKRLFATEVSKNKYVWLAIASCLGIIVLAYLTPAIRLALSIEPMTWYDWAIALSFSLSSLVIIQVLKRINIIK